MKLFATISLPLSIRCIPSFQRSVSEPAPLLIKQDLHFMHSSQKSLLILGIDMCVHFFGLNFRCKKKCIPNFRGKSQAKEKE